MPPPHEKRDLQAYRLHTQHGRRKACLLPEVVTRQRLDVLHLERVYVEVVQSQQRHGVLPRRMKRNIPLLVFLFVALVTPRLHFMIVLGRAHGGKA